MLFKVTGAVTVYICLLWAQMLPVHQSAAHLEELQHRAHRAELPPIKSASGQVFIFFEPLKLWFWFLKAARKQTDEGGADERVSGHTHG